MKKIIFAVLFLCACPGADTPVPLDGQLEPDVLLADAKLDPDASLPDLSKPDALLPDLPLPDAKVDQALPDQQLPDQTPPDQAWPPDKNLCTGVTCAPCKCTIKKCPASYSIPCRKCNPKTGKCEVDLTTPPKYLFPDPYPTGGGTWATFETCATSTANSYAMRTGGGTMRWFDVKEQTGPGTFKFTATNLTTGKAVATTFCTKATPLSIKVMEEYGGGLPQFGFIEATWSFPSWKLACGEAKVGNKIQLCLTITTINVKKCSTTTVVANVKAQPCF